MTRQVYVNPDLEDAKKPSQFRKYLQNHPKLVSHRPAHGHHLYQGPTGAVGVTDAGRDQPLPADVRSHLVRDILRAGLGIVLAAVLTYPLWGRLLG